MTGTGNHDASSATPPSRRDKIEESQEEWISQIVQQRERQLQEGIQLRRLVLDANEAGVSRKIIAARLGMSANSMTHWIKVAREEREDESTTTRRGGRRP